MRLVYKGTEREVKVGDVVTDFRGEKSIVTYFREPHKPGSCGKISTRKDGSDYERESYVSVYGLVWIEREDRM